MKLIAKIVLVFIMTCSCFGLIGSYFIEEMFTPKHLQKAIQGIDFMPLVQENMDNKYQDMMKTLIKTEEFEMIVNDYVSAFVTYLCDGKTTYTISEDIEASLFRQYSTAFLKKYPQLKFLPTELFVEFLVEQIDLNEYLPSFSELKKEIPMEFFMYKDLVVSRGWRECCFAGLMTTFICLCLLSNKVSFYGLGFSFLMISLLLIFFMNQSWVLVGYEWLYPSIEYFISQLNDVLKFCIIVAMGCFLIEWGKFYAKKIFLF